MVKPMAQATDALFEASVDLGPDLARGNAPADSATAWARDIRIEICEDLLAVAPEWRAFEQHADGTVFQTYEWLAAWQRHIGGRNGVRPAIVLGRHGDGTLLFLLPLAVRRRGLVRELTWLGAQLCDYNGPLLAPGFWAALQSSDASTLVRCALQRLREHPRLAYDVIRLDKMPERIGAQPNLMLCLETTLHPSGAYMTELGEDWEAFYRDKRSSATRRRDRTKRNRLAELGAVAFIEAAGDDDIGRTLETLMAQKGRWFAQMGVADIFAPPGHREFYRAIACDRETRDMAHISRLEVGPTIAAANLGLLFRGRYYHLLASYTDGEAARFGPGAAHLHELMRSAIVRRCRIFDFTIGDERYKRDWCDTEQHLHDHVSGATLKGAVIAAAIRAGSALKRWIKQTPAAWSAASKVRKLAGLLRARAFTPAQKP